ncbi:transcription factor EMB1444-like isoform X2 [Ipomoea triloba]|uniref:transcription factor EMB1444-like isoform X2 n=1 Tax=Ipomoea triloba TaxID=35885 RepID=UPI00125D6789|nr:transcription factor EMB1444-like isoform X2 [Ipomoea triloba]
MPSLRQFLQTLCCDSLWNYAVFWKLQHENLMLLSWEDGFFDFPISGEPVGSIANNYCQKGLNDILLSTFLSKSDNDDIGESPIGLAMTEMSNTYHILGKGAVGEVASTGSPLWIFSDILAPGGISSSSVSKCPEEWMLQFLAGIKTILLIPCIPHGVLQLGSLEMVAENAQLVAYLMDRFDALKKSAETSPFISNIESPAQLSAFMPNAKDNLLGINNDNNDFRAGDAYNLSTAGKMASLYMIQDISTGVPGILECDSESKSGMHPMDLISVAEQLNNQFSEDYRWIMTESNVCKSSCLEQEVYATSYSEFYDGECELQNVLAHAFVDQSNHYIQTCNGSGQTTAAGSISNEDLIFNDEPSSWESNGCCFKEDDVDNLLESIVTTACMDSDIKSINASYSTESFHTSLGIPFSASQRRNHMVQGALVGGKTEPWSSPISASVASDMKSLTNSSLECSMGTVVEEQQQKKRSRSMHHAAESECSYAKMKRAKVSDRQPRRPRDRQLIQDRLKELRELVPNSAKCSIDGLLDRTIKHMLFMKNVTDQADKLRQQVKKEVLTGKSLTSSKAKANYQPGTSWALELGSDEQTCPIIVKDLNYPGYMLIEMLCNDHSGFLDIADVIHRLELTILKGVMENRTGGTWARFIVEASGNFHRLDIFWPLMQLLQRSSTLMST